MKSLLQTNRWISFCLGSLALALGAGAPRLALAQFIGGTGGSPVGLNLALVRLFGDSAAFTAKASLRMVDKAQQEILSAPMDFALLNRNLRIQLDLTEIKHKDLPAALANSLKQLGLSQVVSVVRPDKRATYVIYPEMQSYLLLPLSAEEANAALQTPKIEKEALGNDTLDGHPCVKHKVTMTREGGGRLEALVWTATDLKDFPLQLQTTDKDQTATLRFQQVQHVKPDAARFDTPTGFKEYTDYQQILAGLMKRLMGGPPEAK